MKNFGVCYIRTPGVFTDMCEISKSTLPKGTPIHEIIVKSHRESLFERLNLVDNLPFKRTLYLDCDTVYKQNYWPKYITEGNLPLGVAMSAWFLIHQPWSWPHQWYKFFKNVIGDMSNANPVLRAPNSGLILIDEKSKKFFEEWVRLWVNSGDCNLMEPPYIKSVLKDNANKFNILPGNFHIPSWCLNDNFFKLEYIYFIHAIGPTDKKIEIMESLL